MREAVVKEAWSQSYRSSEHLLFGSLKTAEDLSTLHPEQIQIFRLWQIYLENVNPLLKVTHIPSLQGRIIDAASNVAGIEPNLAALMFSIYCVAILSLTEEECRTILGLSREDLLARYQSGCQRALWSCGFLRTNERECLTALYLYLVSLLDCPSSCPPDTNQISIKPVTDPHSLSSMLGVAIRIAQRMGLHSESGYANYTIFEAEMRRRLWWSLVLFDTRICEVATSKSLLLLPTWDCSIPLNVNDFDLRQEMKNPPIVRSQSTEAQFVVVRNELGNFVCHSAFYLTCVDPALETVAKHVRRGSVPEGGELVRLANTIEDKYIRFCNAENPLHFMTIWTARGHLAKYRLIEAFSRYSTSSAQQTDAQRDVTLPHALRMLECDTKLLTSSLTKGYLWLVQWYFPLPAYIYVVQDLRRRPANSLAERTWETISDNYDARCTSQSLKGGPFFKVLGKVILEAWEAHEALYSRSDKPLEPPRVVSDIRQTLTGPTHDAQSANVEQPIHTVGTGIDDFSVSMPMDFGGHGMLYGVEGQGYEGPGMGPSQLTLGTDLNQCDWNLTDYNPLPRRGW